jgi:hypothetical protein
VRWGCWILLQLMRDGEGLGYVEGIVGNIGVGLCVSSTHTTNSPSHHRLPPPHQDTRAGLHKVG